jgi:hypothetical protein
MSPTSYQTAPPRTSMLARGVESVNKIAKSSYFFGAAGLLCSLEGGTIFFSRRYVTMLP